MYNKIIINMSLTFYIILHLIFLVIIYENRFKMSNKVYYLIFGCIITSLIYSCLYNNLSAELNNIIEQLNMLK